MPAGIDSSEYIPQFIASFQALCRKAFIHPVYKSGVVAITKHDGLIVQILEDGNYWHVTDTAGHKVLIMKSHTCFSEVLLDYTIKEVVLQMFNMRKDPSTWTKTVQVALISKMFNGILPCPVRAVPNGPNDLETFKSVKGQNIQHWIMSVPMPAGIDSLEYIPQFIASFQALCRKAVIRSA